MCIVHAPWDQLDPGSVSSVSQGALPWPADEWHSVYGAYGVQTDPRRTPHDIPGHYCSSHCTDDRPILRGSQNGPAHRTHVPFVHATERPVPSDRADPSGHESGVRDSSTSRNSSRLNRRHLATLAGQISILPILNSVVCTTFHGGEGDRCWARRTGEGDWKRRDRAQASYSIKHCGVM